MRLMTRIAFLESLCYKKLVSLKGAAGLFTVFQVGAGILPREL